MGYLKKTLSKYLAVSQLLPHAVAMNDRYKSMTDERFALSRDRDANHRLIFGGNSTTPQRGDDEMHIGDTTNYVTSQSSFGKALLGIGLLATGVGGGTGAYFIADAIKNRPIPVIQEIKPAEIEDTDTDTVIEWNLE